MAFVIIASVFLILWWCNQSNNPTDSQNYNEKSEWHFAIIPHFMLDSDKVDQFYKTIKENYSKDWNYNPDKIVIISPNHFHSEIKKPQTICKSDFVYFNLQKEFFSDELNKLWIECNDSEKIFYSWGESIKTNEHWIWEHFKRIEKYFSEATILPLIMPTHNFENIENTIKNLQTLNWNILVIASVDFAHYQPESQTLQHDEKSIQILEWWDNNIEDFRTWIDADCPTCLFTLQSLAKSNWQKAELRYRDSSSIILHRDMWEENTSRIFMLYK